MSGPQQILHIVKKDAQHLAPEIVTSLLLLVAFAWSAPAGWTGRATGMEQVPLLVAAALHILLPTAWLILVSRVVHDEPLVGDRQFWVTRPYTWSTLLGAKVSFLLAFICLPLLIMQGYLIHHAGLPVPAAMPRLLGNVAAIGLLFLLPFTAIAAVTATVGRLMLSLLGGFVYVILLFVGTGYLHGLQALPPYEPTVAAWLAVALLAGVVIYQYMTRRTAVARGLLLGVPVVLCLLLLLTPSGLLFRRIFPEAGYGADSKTGINPQLSFLADPAHAQPGAGSPFVLKGNVFLLLPVEVSGIPADVKLDGKAIQMEIDGRDGFRWDSTWQMFPGSLGNGPSQYGIVMPEKVFQKVSGAPVSVRLTMAVDAMRQGAPVVAASRVSGYSVPDGGICSFLPDEEMAPICRYPVHGPELTLISAPVVQEPCGLNSPGTTPEPGNMGQGGIAQQAGLPVAFDPVFATGLRFYVAGQNPNQPRMNALCPGTGVSFTPFQAAGRLRVSVSAPDVKLGDYARRIGPRPAGIGEQPSQNE